jgi:hypothetical protein
MEKHISEFENELVREQLLYGCCVICDAAYTPGSSVQLVIAVQPKTLILILVLAAQFFVYTTVKPRYSASVSFTAVYYYYYYYYYYLLQLGFHPVAAVLTLVHTIQMDI